MLSWDHHKRGSLWSHPCAAAVRPLTRRRRHCVAAVLLLAACSSGYDPVQRVDALRSQNKTADALRLAERVLSQNQGYDRVYWELALRKTEFLEKLNRRE